MTFATRTRHGWRLPALCAASLLVVLSSTHAAPVAAQEPTTGYTQGGQGYLLDDGRFTPIAFPGATGTLPFAINNRGQIVGAYDDRDGRTHGFIYESGRYRTIDAPEATGTTPDGLTGSGAGGITDHGTIVGSYIGADNHAHGYILGRRGFRTIDIPGATDTTVFNINERGQMTLQGSSPEEPLFDFLYDDGEFTRVEFPGAEATRVHKIDGRGQVVGVYGIGNVQHGFTLRRGRYRTLDFEGFDNTGLNASNERGQIVGYVADGDLADPAAVVHGASLKRGRLTVFDAPGPPEGPSATTAYDVNDRGQIVGAKLPAPDPAAAIDR